MNSCIRLLKPIIDTLNELQSDSCVIHKVFGLFHKRAGKLTYLSFNYKMGKENYHEQDSFSDEELSEGSNDESD